MACQYVRCEEEGRSVKDLELGGVHEVQLGQAVFSR